MTCHDAAGKAQAELSQQLGGQSSLLSVTIANTNTVFNWQCGSLIPLNAMIATSDFPVNFCPMA